MAGQGFVMGGAARGFTVVPASTAIRMSWAILGRSGRVCQAHVGEQARLDNGLVPR